MSPASLARRVVAELVGTFILVFLGCGAVHSAVLTGAQSGLWQVAIVWGLGVTLAIYVVGGVSGAHINPAMTIAFAVWGRFPKREAPAYIAAQLVGAFAAAALLFAMYHNYLDRREQQWGVERGQPGSQLTASCYGEFFPNPGGLKIADGETYWAAAHAEYNKLVSEGLACLIEIAGTAVLAIVVFAVTDTRNAAGPMAGMAPAFIGLTVAALISLIAPLTQACFNPARDFGPRVFAFLAGWGAYAFPDGTGFFTVYIMSPALGAVLGGGLYLGLIRPGQTGAEEGEWRGKE